MSVFSPVKKRNLGDHFKEIVPIVKSQFRHVTKPLVNIPGFTETYLRWRNFIRRIKGDDPNKSVHDVIKEEYVKKYPDYNFPEHVLNALIDYSVYRYFIQTPELRPPTHSDLVEDIIEPVKQNQEILLSEFASEVERKRIIARKYASRSLATSNITALTATRPNNTISQFLVGKKRKTQKKSKGKKGRRSKTNKRKR